MSVTKQSRAGLFDMILRSTNAVIDRIYAPSLDDARDMYHIRKQLILKDFDKLFDVKHAPEHKREV